ncbi:MAG: carbamoyl-phosphate synthase large subunit [bacterium]
MPKRTDIEKILIIGSGPIIIGQACEFDYSGTQACKALKQEGYRIVLVNNNPATIMTDPELADSTYLEPLTVAYLEKIIERERPDVILPTVGGQTALNLAVELSEAGILERYGVELIGAKLEAIHKAEDREAFKKAMIDIGLKVPRSGVVSSFEEAGELLRDIGFPLILRPSYTLGGSGGNIAYNMEEFHRYVRWGLEVSPKGEILIEESVLGWKEFELEVMRDLNDNVVIICSIENFDPMGVHTGDSITVAPALTLTDKEYQLLRDASIKIIREIGVETGGSNIQFGVSPENGEICVIEMNPRVSRSSALASKATGFPIAKIAALLAVGYRLDEIRNDITRETPASFEPAIDYCVTKIPRFTFDKFPGGDETLTTQMKSVGEVMAIGRNFKESFQKAIRSLEIDRYGLESVCFAEGLTGDKAELIARNLRIPNWQRIWFIADAFRADFSVGEVHEITAIDPWFLENIKQIVELEQQFLDTIAQKQDLSADLWKSLKQSGFSDKYLGRLIGISEGEVRERRRQGGTVPVYKLVDTCAAEFEAYTPYLYSSYETECEAAVTTNSKIMILGGGPNRIGQGIEFDYCCVHASFALKEAGFETIMVNCNPETVSTDYDTSDRLYFEPLTLEDVQEIIRRENPDGVIVQFGGQTPLKLAKALKKEGARIIGTSPDDIDRAEDRNKFNRIIRHLKLQQPAGETATSFEEAGQVAVRIGFPVMVRPSYVLGGRAMEIVYDLSTLERYITKAIDISPEHPILIDKFLEDAIEVDVDAICDGDLVVIGRIMEHIEEAGIHSGDSACSLPPYSIDNDIIDEIRRQTELLARELNVIGLLNIQFAVQADQVYILEVNPRASRTVPFVSKAIGVPLAKLAALVMSGKSLRELGFTREKEPKHISVKEAVFPFIKFPGVDTLLGPEMKSTGEVMGIDTDFGLAYAKAQQGIGGSLPLQGTVFISVKDKDKPLAVSLAGQLTGLGFEVVATRGTHLALQEKGINSTLVKKVSEGRPHIVDIIKDNKISLVINTIEGKRAKDDSYELRRASLVGSIPYFTTISGAKAALQAISSQSKLPVRTQTIQKYHLH